jgi:RNA polymerase sigma-70 factor (ECF subfamily)
VSDAAQLGHLPLERDSSGSNNAAPESDATAALGLTPSEIAEVVRRFPNSAFLGDLLLARACALGREPAWDRFLVVYRSKLFQFAAAIAKDDSIARELADSLYADLFGTKQNSDGRRVSKLDSYSGRGSLEGWLRTVVAQEYVNRYRQVRKFTQLDENAIEKIGTVSEPVPQSFDVLAKATDAALNHLQEEEKLLLSLYYLDGRTLAEIGRLFHRHESSIARRLDKVLDSLRKEIVQNLRDAGLSKQAAKEMLESDVRDIDVNVRRRLEQERRADAFSK